MTEIEEGITTMNGGIDAFYEYTRGIMEREIKKSSLSRVDIVLLVLLWLLTAYISIAENLNSDETISHATKLALKIISPVASGAISLIKTILSSPNILKVVRTVDGWL